MKRLLTFLLTTLLLFSFLFPADGQEAKSNRIKGGFYLKLGAVIPVGAYAAGQIIIPGVSTKSSSTLSYLPAKIGGALDLGYLIYIGPAFANKFLRAGIDATFLSFWFNSTKPVDPSKPAYHWYYYVGQKFGPLITINPIDRLMIDLSWKINANVAYSEGEWDSYQGSYSKFGMNFFQQEVSLGIRYSLIAMQFQYSFGNMVYNDFDNSRKKQKIRADNIRIMIGFQF
ncbi:MAG: hypothetical protein WCO93_11345 [bacterium]